TEGSPSYDIVGVEINAGTDWVTLLSSSDGTLPTITSGWEHASVDLSAYAGSTVTLRFTFDTRDEIENNYEGWFIDNVSIETIDSLAFVGRDGVDVQRLNLGTGAGQSGWAAGAPSGGIGGDGTGREFGYFPADNAIHEFDPNTDTNSFISTLPSPAA